MNPADVLYPVDAQIYPVDVFIEFDGQWSFIINSHVQKSSSLLTRIRGKKENNFLTIQHLSIKFCSHRG